jgi:hypothetical protein
VSAIGFDRRLIFLGNWLAAPDDFRNWLTDSLPKALPTTGLAKVLGPRGVRSFF